MSNFKYRFVKSEFVLSAEEHEKVLESLRDGNTQMVLRGGRLGFNLNAPFQFEETQEMTEPQKASAIAAKAVGQRKYEESVGQRTPEELASARRFMDDIRRKFGKKA